MRTRGKASAGSTALALSAAVLLMGCSKAADFASPALNTPYSFSANKVFYLDAPQRWNECDDPWTGGRPNEHGAPPEAQFEDYRRLLTDSQVADRIRRDRTAIDKAIDQQKKRTTNGGEAEESAPATTAFDSSILSSAEIDGDTIKRISSFAQSLPVASPTLEQVRDAYTAELVTHDQPLAIIVNGVRLPADSAGRRDIAVLLEVESSTEIERRELVVAYQRDVPPNQMLNFSDRLVYFDPHWDSSNPVEFRLRVMDVKSERNDRARELLKQADSIVSSIGAIVPHPAIPGIEVAFAAAEQIVANRRNTVLIDYLVQFHSEATFVGSNSADIGLLRRGSWMVVGRPTFATDAYWAQPLYKHRRTDEIVTGPLTPDATWKGIRQGVPYMEITVSTADVQVPKGVFDRSEQLLQLLSTTGKDDPDALENSLLALDSSIKGYAAERRLKKHRTLADLGEVIELLHRTNGAKAEDGEQSESGTLGTSQRRSLLNTVRLVLGTAWDEVLATSPVDLPTQPSDKRDPQVVRLFAWWNKTGKSGRIEADPLARFGFRWAEAEAATGTQE